MSDYTQWDCIDYIGRVGAEQRPYLFIYFITGLGDHNR